MMNDSCLYNLYLVQNSLQKSSKEYNISERRVILMFLDVLRDKFGVNEPIFTQEILETFNKYSRPRVFQLIKEAENNGGLVKYDYGIYYIPKFTDLGISTISVEKVVQKKYISNSDKTFGIYGKSVLDANFKISYQIPQVIEVITNNEFRKYREINIKNRKIILRKARCEITKDNKPTYTLLELITNLNIKDYMSYLDVRKSILDYIKEFNISYKNIEALISYFPNKTLKKIEEIGLKDVFA